MKKRLNIPRFKSEDEERAFWARTDLSEHFSPGDFERISFPNLKPTSRPISIRIPEYLLNRLKEKANELNVPYQSLIKQYIKAGVFPEPGAAQLARDAAAPPSLRRRRRASRSR